MIYLVYLLAVVFMVLEFGDVYTTKRGMDHGTVESNPIVAWCIKKLTFNGAMSAKILLSLAATIYVVTMFPVNIAILAFVLMCALQSWVVWHNYKLV
jgi:hypothetical protein